MKRTAIIMTMILLGGLACSDPLLDKLVDQNLLIDLDGWYAVEFDGYRDISREEKIPETMDGQWGYTVGDVLTFVVYNVDDNGILENFHQFVLENREDFPENTDETYLEQLSLRRQGKYILGNGQVINNVRDVRREKSIINSFITLSEREMTTPDGHTVIIEAGNNVYVNKNGIYYSGSFKNPITLTIPVIGNVQAIQANWYNEDHSSLSNVCLDAPVEFDTSLGVFHGKSFSFSQYMFEVRISEKKRISFVNNQINVFSGGTVSFYPESMALKTVRGIDAGSTVTLPDGTKVWPTIGTTSSKMLYFYENGNIKECVPDEDVELSIGGLCYNHMAGQRLWFHPNGTVDKFTPVEGTILLIDGKEIIPSQKKWVYFYPDGTLYQVRAHNDIEFQIDGRNIPCRGLLNFYPNGSLKSCQMKSSMKFIIDGKEIKTKRDTPYSNSFTVKFYPDGSILGLNAENELTMELFNGDEIIVGGDKSKWIEFDRNGKIIAIDLTYPYTIEHEGVMKTFNRLRLNEETGELESGRAAF